MDLKKRFKLYKAKKNWLLTGITTVGVVFGSTVMAAADTNVQPVVTTAAPQVSQVQSASVAPTAQTSASSTADQNATSANSATAVYKAATQAAATPAAKPVTKEVNQNGHWYLQDQKTGTYLNGWQNLSNNRVVYYDPQTNQMQYGEQKISDQWYYLRTDNGDVISGWYRLKDGRNVYYDVKKQNGTVTGQGMLHGMQPVNGTYYYFNDWNGDRQTGFKKVKGQTYYFAPTMVTGERSINGHWYFFSTDGVMQTGFVKLPDGRLDYYNDQGQMLYGEQQLNGHWYYFRTDNGDVARGFTKLADGRTVYYDVNSDGKGRGMLHGIQSVNGKTYAFRSDNGDRETGLVRINGKIYGFNPSQVTGEQQINGKWYYFAPKTGEMQTGFVTLPDGRLVYYNPQGQMLHGEQQINGQWYAFRSDNGDTLRGWTTLADGRKVYYDVDAQGKGKGMLHGYNLVNGSLYNFDRWNGNLIGKVANDLFYNATTGQLQYYNADGKLVKDQAVKLGNQTYQADAQGNLQITGDGEHAINGHWYLYDAKNGKFKTSWQTLADGRTVYYGPQAYMLYGHQTIDGHGYFFNRVNGALTKGWLQDGHDWYYYNPNNGQAQTGTATINGVTYRFDNSGKQILNYAIDYRYALNAGEGDEDTAANNYIVLHEVGTESGGAANANYFKQDWEKVEAYTTFVVGDGGRVYQVGRPGQVSWGAGRVANHNAPVQIELGRTYNANQFWRDYTAYVRLARDMAGKFGIPLTLDVGGAGTRGIKSHNWVSHNIWGDHVDPYGYLARFGVTQAKLAHDLQYGI